MTAKRRVGPLRRDGQPRPKCRISGCERIAEGYKDLCEAHIQRAKHSPNIPMEAPFIHPYDRSGSRNPKWRGGEIDDGTGRILVYSPGHPYPSRCGTHVYRYRLLMERHLGRYLKPQEIVHHKNGIRDDDRIENLEVMSQSEHARIHMAERHQARKSA